jgi:hypothetical protein
MLLILAVLGLVAYGIYRATRRWGAAVLWCVAAAISALNASGVIAERLWGPRYSWNFAHHGLDSLPGTLITFLRRNGPLVPQSSHSASALMVSSAFSYRFPSRRSRFGVGLHARMRRFAPPHTYC